MKWLTICALFLSSIGLLCVSTSQAGERTGEDLVEVDLLSSVDSVKAGQPFQIAVRLKLESQWHVYWLNPGDAGQAPSIKWKLPEGATVSDLSFPIPNIMTDEYKSVIYGYENELVLLATITPGKNMPTDFEISADVSWLICREKCLMGKKNVTIKLPAGTAAPANTEIFSKASAALPEVGQSSEIKQIWTDATHGQLVISWTTDTSPDAFPPPCDFAVFDQAQHQDSKIILPFRVLKGQKVTPATFPLILATKKDGKRIGFQWTVVFKQP